MTTTSTSTKAPRKKYTRKTAPAPFHQRAPGDLVTLVELTPQPIPVSKTTIRRWIKMGAFPAPVSIGGEGDRHAYWRVATIRAWLDKTAGEVQS